MLARIFPVFMALFLVIAVVGCEGDTGPAGPSGAAGQDGADGPTGPVGPSGPSTILAFGDIDDDGPTVLSSGPSGTTVSVTTAGLGDFTVTLDGTFPSTTGVLIVSPASDVNPFDNCFPTGQIQTWTTTQIVIRVRYYCTNNIYINDEFSFVVLGE